MILAVAVLVTVVLSLVSYYQQQGALDGRFFVLQEHTIAGFKLLDIWLAVIAVVAILLWRVLLDHPVQGADPVAERRHLLVFLSLLALYMYVVLWSTMYLAQQDSYWYVTQLSASAPVPTFPIILYVSTPIYIVVGGAIYCYVRTRLSRFLSSANMTFWLFLLLPLFFQADAGAEAWYRQDPKLEQLYLAAYWVITGIWLVIGAGGLLLKVIQRLAALLRSENL